MFPPLSILSFYSIATMNGYKSISDSIYYPSAAITAAWSAYKGLVIPAPQLSTGQRIAGILLGASMGTGLTAIMGHNTGRAIRETLCNSEKLSTSSPGLPSFPHNGA